MHSNTDWPQHPYHFPVLEVSVLTDILPSCKTHGCVFKFIFSTQNFFPPQLLRELHWLSFLLSHSWLHFSTIPGVPSIRLSQVVLLTKFSVYPYFRQLLYQSSAFAFPQDPLHFTSIPGRQHITLPQLLLIAFLPVCLVRLASVFHICSCLRTSFCRFFQQVSMFLRCCWLRKFNFFMLFASIHAYMLCDLQFSTLCFGGLLYVA
jgi:hypothetical protein